MRTKTVIFIFCLVAVGIGTFFGIFNFSTNSNAATPQVEPSMDIGALFPQDEVQINYSSFAPTVTRIEAIWIAKGWLHNGFHIATDNLPADSTVALFNGVVSRTETRSPHIVSNVQAWIVVIKAVPLYTSAGPYNPKGAIRFATQADVAIDATTREVLNAEVVGKRLTPQ